MSTVLLTESMRPVVFELTDSLPRAEGVMQLRDLLGLMYKERADVMTAHLSINELDQLVEILSDKIVKSVVDMRDAETYNGAVANVLAYSEMMAMFTESLTERESLSFYLPSDNEEEEEDEEEEEEDERDIDPERA